MSEQLTETDGRQLAVDMLRELGDEWKSFNDAFTGVDIEDALIDREPATLRRFLRVIQKNASPALERGFLCVLSEYLGSAAAGGSVLDLDAYEAHKDKRHG